MKDLDTINGFSFEGKELDESKVQIIDKLLVKGMGIDRDTNDTNVDYIRVNKFEKRGIRTFVHKFNLGMQDFYFQKLYGDMLESSSKEAFMKDYEKAYLNDVEMRDKGRQMKKDYSEKGFRFVLRITIQMLDNSLGDYKYGEEEERKDLQKAGVEKSSGNHIAIFECQLTQPPVMSMMDISQYEYLMSNRLNFKNWRIVDLDNYMKGNPPYTDFLSQVEWDKEFQRYEDGKMIINGDDTRTKEGRKAQVEKIQEYTQYQQQMM